MNRCTGFCRPLPNHSATPPEPHELQVRNAVYPGMKRGPERGLPRARGSNRLVDLTRASPQRPSADSRADGAGHRPGAWGSRRLPICPEALPSGAERNEVVPSNLGFDLSASYCPFGLSASRIVGGPFGPFLSIARNRVVRYSAPVHSARGPSTPSPRDPQPYCVSPGTCTG